MTQTLSARAVLLDMDGTLVDSTPVVERIWRAWADQHGIDVETVFSVIHGRQGHASMAMLLPDRPHEENLAENALMLEAETADIDGVVEVPGAARLLAAIADVPHALVTSASLALATARMTAAGLGMPKLSITAEDVTRSKPDPEGFLAAALALGIPPEECVVFEDSGAGISAARAAGMRVIGVGPHAASHNPDWAVADLNALTVSTTAEGVTFTAGTPTLDTEALLEALHPFRRLTFNTARKEAILAARAQKITWRKIAEALDMTELAALNASRWEPNS